MKIKERSCQFYDTAISQFAQAVLPESMEKLFLKMMPSGNQINNKINKTPTNK